MFDTDYDYDYDYDDDLDGPLVTSDTPLTTHALDLLSIAEPLSAFGISVVLADPTCCRSCANAHLELTGPHLVGYRLDGRQNDVTAWDREEFGTEFLSWNACELDQQLFLQLVGAALERAGFSVTLPADDTWGIEVAR